ncbi:MAG: preprotein translocase subunit YajC [Propionibacteriaceae bacterium]|jgi:preprotein translocase subunit YajC|nr:preprotein translocase subunit YajC [Propionibacteriaceae bacterium]
MDPISLVILVAVIVGGYFLMYRPNKKRQDAAKAAMAALGPGSRVMTVGGIIGTIVELGEKTLILEVNPDTQIIVLREGLAVRPAPDEEFSFEDDSDTQAEVEGKDEYAPSDFSSTFDEPPTSPSDER